MILSSNYTVFLQRHAEEGSTLVRCTLLATVVGVEDYFDEKIASTMIVTIT